MNNNFLWIGATLGFLAVGLGAFGAHALEEILEANQHTDTYQTASDYHFYHAISILIIGVLYQKLSNKWLKYAGYLHTVGVLIFSGTLYIYSITNITLFAIITPIGGVLLIIGWAFLLLGFRQK